MPGMLLCLFLLDIRRIGRWGERCDMLWDSRADLGIWDSFAFMRARSSFLAAFKTWGVAIRDLSGGPGAREGGIGMSGMFV